MPRNKRTLSLCFKSALVRTFLCLFERKFAEVYLAGAHAYYNSTTPNVKDTSIHIRNLNDFQEIEFQQSRAASRGRRSA